VNRHDITTGAAGLGVPLDEHIAFCLQAMQGNADALALRGSAPGQ
jgi:predicted hydrolase (HD superfamily)